MYAVTICFVSQSNALHMYKLQTDMLFLMLHCATYLGHKVFRFVSTFITGTMNRFDCSRIVLHQ